MSCLSLLGLFFYEVPIINNVRVAMGIACSPICICCMGCVIFPFLTGGYCGWSVGAEADEDKIELLLSQVNGKDITELIAAGREKLASVPAGGGGAVAVAAASAGGGGAAAAAPAAESKKEEKVEEKEESDEV